MLNVTSRLHPPLGGAVAVELSDLGGARGARLALRLRGLSQTLVEPGIGLRLRPLLVSLLLGDDAGKLVGVLGLVTQLLGLLGELELFGPLGALAQLLRSFG